MTLSNETQTATERFFKEVFDVVEAHEQATDIDSRKGERVTIGEGAKIAHEIIDLRRLPSLADLKEDFFETPSADLVEMLESRKIITAQQKATAGHIIDGVKSFALAYRTWRSDKIWK